MCKHRRILLDPIQNHTPVLSKGQIHSALENIDAVQNRDGLTVGLFSVFPAAGYRNQSTLDSHQAGNDVNDTSVLPIGLLEMFRNDAELDNWSSQHCPGLQIPKELSLQDARSSHVEVVEMGVSPKLSPQLEFLSSDYSYLSLGLNHDCQLMHYWITFLSGLMTSTQRPDNFFQDIITPLALTATNVHHDSSGHHALLHSLYALTAFNRANLCASSQSEHDAGTRHAKKSLQYLCRSLKPGSFEQQQATLAAIYILSVIPAFTGETSDWRVHLRGGTAWLQSIDKSAWRQNQSAVTLYQMLLCVDVLRPMHRIIAKDMEPQISSLGLEEQGSVHATRQRDGDVMHWHLDIIWGVTQPIMEAIHQLNQWLFREYNPSSEETESLRLKIVLNDPSKLRFPSPTKICEDLTQHHACVFYYACQIYFYCSLQKLPPRYIQHIVRQTIEQIETIELLETDFNVSGLLWPAFITACETEGICLRPRILRYFSKRETLGIGNVSIAKQVVLKVWSRRDKAEADENVLWYYVMAEMGIDILLS